MLLKVINREFSVCKVSDFSEVDMGQPYIFIGSTNEERSLVCPTELVPDNTIERNDGWRAFRIDAMRDCEARVASEMEKI